MTGAYLGLVLAQYGNLYALRNRTHIWWKAFSIYRNPAFTLAIFGTLGIICMMIYIPQISLFFHMDRLVLRDYMIPVSGFGILFVLQTIWMRRKSIKF